MFPSSNIPESTNLCLGTPSISVIDNRGLAVRGLQYNRSVADGPLDERITRSQYSDLGFATSQIDPRLFTLPPSDPPVTPNFQHQSSLSGQSLRTLSVDAGDTAALFDIEGREVWRRDGRGTQIRRTYDTLGRVNAVQEQQAAPAASVCSDRLIYVDTSTDAGGAGQAANQRGQLVRHYDTGGLREIPGYSLQGPMASETRQLLASLDTPADWAGSAEPSWQAKLAAEQYTTAWQYDALGTVLAQTDARGNRQRKVLDVAGQVQTASLTQAAQPEKVVLSGVTYSAAGQPLGETAGNGVVTSYTYEAQTQRLTRVTSTKPDKSTVQDLSYTYDPVGNLLNIDDGTQPATFYKNRAVSASRQYTYDALYQLLSATGRENDNAGQQGPTLPGPLTDPEQLVGYTRYYTYDRGGNLMQIQHQGSANYSNPIVVSDRSNHAVAQTAANALKPSDIDTGPYFDACGNSLQQTPGRPLTWNARNQLLTAVTVDRGADPAQNDRESYGYDGNGMRLWKVSQSQTSGTVRQQKVIYLHGLELRTTTSDQTPVETLEVIAAGQIGHASLSVLSWTLGQPSGIPNNQYRYSLGDQVGSVNLELNDQAAIITAEEFYPYGGTAVWGGSASQVKYKFIRYSGKERDATGLYYYGYRYLMPWLGRWLNADPGGTVDGLNLYRMVRENPASLADSNGEVTSIAMYGFSGPRQTAIGQAQQSDPDKAYVTIDEYNRMLGLIPDAGLTDRAYYSAIKGDIPSPNAGYIETVAKRYHENGLTGSQDEARALLEDQTQKWAAFLRSDNRYEKLDIGKKILGLMAADKKEGGRGRSSKWKFWSKRGSSRNLDAFIYKNSKAEGAPDLKSARKALAAFAESGSFTEFAGKVKDTSLQGWVWDVVANRAFPRQTSKLGLDWFSQDAAFEGIQFRVSTIDDKPLDLSVVAEKPWKNQKRRQGSGGIGYAEPITYSELRHIQNPNKFSGKSIVRYDCA